MAIQGGFNVRIAPRLCTNHHSSTIEKLRDFRLRQVAQATDVEIEILSVAEHSVVAVGILADGQATPTSATLCADAIRLEHLVAGQKANRVVAIVGVAGHVQDAETILRNDLFDIRGGLVIAAVIVASQATIHDEAADVVRAEGNVAALAAWTGALESPITDATNQRLLEVHVASVSVALDALH